MAALLVVGALALADRVVEKKKEKKRNKKARDEKRYRELQRETTQRMAPFDDESRPDSEEEGEDVENVRVAGDEKAPPAYEDAVSVGARREEEWRARMQRRRSSVQSRGSEAPVRPENFMRMG